MAAQKVRRQAGQGFGGAKAEAKAGLTRETVGPQRVEVNSNLTAGHYAKESIYQAGRGVNLNFARQAALMQDLALCGGRLVLDGHLVRRLRLALGMTRRQLEHALDDLAARGRIVLSAEDGSVRVVEEVASW